MGIQINGQTDTITAIDGSLIVSGAELPTVTNLNATGVVTATSFRGGAYYFSSNPFNFIENSGANLIINGDDNILFRTDNTVERVRIDSSGNLGIGTNNPSDKLSIWSAPNALVLGAKDTTRGNHIFQLLADDAQGHGELRLYRNSASGTHEKTVEIASNGISYLIGGNTGIGTISPSYILDVFSTSFPTAKFNSNYTTSSKEYTTVVLGNASTNGGAGIGFVRDTVTAANSFFHITPYGNTEGSGGISILPSGNVGVGLTNPSTKLQVSGTIFSNNAGTGTLHLGYTSSSSRVAGGIIASESPSYAATGKLGFYVTCWGSGTTYGLTEVMAIDQRLADNNSPTIWMNGNLGIGTNSPGNKLDVRGGVVLKSQSNTEGLIFQAPRPTTLASVLSSGGRGIVESTIPAIPNATTTNIAQSHWGGLVLIGYSSGSHQGYQLVSFGYNGSPSVLHTVNWIGSLVNTYSMSGYTLRVSHNGGTNVDFWVILIGV